MDSITGIFTRAEKTRAASICNKSAITDHVCNENHVTDWANAKVIDWESDKAGRLITKGGNMDQEDRQHESRWGELPVEPCMGQAFTYWRPAPEVSPDEGFRWSRNVDKQYVVFGCIRVINIVFVSTWWNFSQDTHTCVHANAHAHAHAHIRLTAQRGPQSDWSVISSERVFVTSTSEGKFPFLPWHTMALED